MSDDSEPIPATTAPGEAPAPKPPRTALYRSKSLLRLGLEVLLISAGVFLGLMGEQWRERAQHRELAEQSLGRFRSEIVANRAAVSRVKDYHVTMKKGIDAYLAADDKARTTLSVRLQGIQPALFEHTAWDLALATQSLAYLDSDLAYDLSRIYGSQQTYSTLTAGILQAMYLRPPTSDLRPFLEALSVYYGDVVAMEPALLRLYDEILPKIERAIDGSGKTAAVRR
jgi:hypothetical protein